MIFLKPIVLENTGGKNSRRKGKGETKGQEGLSEMEQPEEKENLEVLGSVCPS